MNGFFSKIFGLLQGSYNFGDALVLYAAKLRPFVVTAAKELDALIPAGGMGDVKLMAFDEALKVFVAANADFDHKAVAIGDNLWTVAHWLLEAYLSAQKALAAVTAAAPAAAPGA